MVWRKAWPRSSHDICIRESHQFRAISRVFFGFSIGADQWNLDEIDEEGEAPARSATEKNKARPIAVFRFL